MDGKKEAFYQCYVLSLGTDETSGHTLFSIRFESDIPRVISCSQGH